MFYINDITKSKTKSKKDGLGRYTEFLTKNKSFYHLKTLSAFKKVDLKCIILSFAHSFHKYLSVW